MPRGRTSGWDPNSLMFANQIPNIKNYFSIQFATYEKFCQILPQEDPRHEDMNKLFSIQKFPPEMTMTKRGNLLQPSQDMASEARPVSFDLLVKDVSIKRKK